VKLFYETASVKLGKGDLEEQLAGKYAAEDIVYPAGHDRCGEILVECCHPITKTKAAEIGESGLKSVSIIADASDHLVINSILEDGTASHEEALLRIYQRLRPGNPPQLEK